MNFEKLEGHGAIIPTPDAVRTTAAFLGMHLIKKFILFQNRAFDWTIFDTINHTNNLGTSVVELNELCKKLMIPWVYKESVNSATAN